MSVQAEKPIKELKPITPLAEGIPLASKETFWKKLRTYRLAYLLVSPVIVCMLFIHFIPGGLGVYMSFLDLKQSTWLRFLGAPFIGLDNYNTLFTSQHNALASQLQLAARNTFLYAIVTNVGTIGLGLISAMLINHEFRGRGIVRSLLMLPWVVPSFVVGLLWGFMFRIDTGIVNTILTDWLHLTDQAHRISWLQNENVFWAITIPTIWRGYPFTMVLLLSGLQTISTELYEAAEIDGASAWQRFQQITLPLLKPIFAVVTLWGVIGSAYAFNLVATMFGNGAGYPGEWGDLLQTAVQRNTFNGSLRYGIGSAATTIFMIVMLIFVAIWYKVFRQSLTVDQKS
ncbi:MAG TPA: sugar ABC transporter permease [Chloroflexia bacterium]|nr:sugar ABC transporter permease [Chloroflexia bacterium]